jgi:hypothetical protein
MIIPESGMNFGPFDKDSCFYIEKSDLYCDVQKGVQMAEFLWLRPGDATMPRVWIVEAKSSSPRPATQPNFDNFISEIAEKMRNSLSLFLAARLGRHPNHVADIPVNFGTMNLATADFHLVLVIHGHEDRWLPPLQRALCEKLHSTAQTWALSSTAVAVINEISAQKYGLIK